MIEGLTPAEPTLDGLEEIVSCAERRVKRAATRMERAQAELGDAAAALVQARDERAAFIAADPGILL